MCQRVGSSLLKSFTLRYPSPALFFCGYRTMVVRRLAMAQTGVRFPLPAPTCAAGCRTEPRYAGRRLTVQRTPAASVGRPIRYTKIMWFYVYILESEKGHQYVGHTENLDARLKEHNEGSVVSTENKRPWHIQWFCGFKTLEESIAWEKHLKTGSGTAIRYKHLVPNKLP